MFGSLAEAVGNFTDQNGVFAGSLYVEGTPLTTLSGMEPVTTILKKAETDHLLALIRRGGCWRWRRLIVALRALVRRWGDRWRRRRRFREQLREAASAVGSTRTEAERQAGVNLPPADGHDRHGGRVHDFGGNHHTPRHRIVSRPAIRCTVMGPSRDLCVPPNLRLLLLLLLL